MQGKRRSNKWISPALFAFGALGVFIASASGHPLSQGSLDVTIRSDRIDVRAKVTLEEVSVTNMLLPPDPLHPLSGASDEAFELHARYLAAHLRITQDGKALVARVVRVAPPGSPTAATNASNQRATYELEYQASSPAAAVLNPSKVELSDTVLTDLEFLPGTKWEATYVVRIGQPDRPAAEGLLLLAGKPIVFDCDWGAPAAGAASKVDRGRMAREYFLHGVHHILTGYDHLLFISALVLATTKLWDLLKVVTAFTIAHTITLALAAMNWVRLPGQVVEPMIAGSIVFVAIQNVIWPRQSHGWTRLAAAFFFGLFHGLGFAGGLLEAMQEMPVSSKLLAIATFSLGVEAGHQMIVLPLFAGLKIARSTRDDEVGKARVSMLAQRFGSAAVSLAGMFYLVVALRMSFAK